MKAQKLNLYVKQFQRSNRGMRFSLRRDVTGNYEKTRLPF